VIHAWNAEIAAALAAAVLPGGIVPAWSLASDSCASFLLGSSFDVADMSPNVTRPLSEPFTGGSEWQPTHCVLRIAWTAGEVHAPVGGGGGGGGGGGPASVPPDDDVPPDVPEVPPEVVPEVPPELVPDVPPELVPSTDPEAPEVPELLPEGPPNPVPPPASSFVLASPHAIAAAPEITKAPNK
jgi:hypothetical protein